MTDAQYLEDYRKIERAIQFLETNFRRQPSLKEIAEAAHLSEFHFQRLFGRWVGISPKRFLQFLTKAYACQLLEESQNLLDTTFESGLTSSGRLHDLLVSCEAVTPGEYKTGGSGLEIRYSIENSPFGQYLLARTERGICNLLFIMEDGIPAAVRLLEAAWPNASIRETSGDGVTELDQFFNRAGSETATPLHLHLKGTNFQIKVWEALLRIPHGHVLSYHDVAAMIGNPNAVRAVASAVGKNPVSLIIPCHRVIRKMGSWHSYRWGSVRKKAILGWEAAHHHQEISAGIARI